MNLVKLLAAAGLVLSAPVCFSETLATLQNSFTESGWSFWWNEKGELGDPALYTEMAAIESDSESQKFTALPKDPGWLFVGLLTEKGHVGQVGGLPGPGPEQTNSKFGFAAIFAYTIAKEGKISIAHSSLSTIYDSQDGITISVFVNSEAEPRVTKATKAGEVSEVSFDVGLGDLATGDTIYFAVSPNQNNFSDSFGIDCEIVTGK